MNIEEYHLIVLWSKARTQEMLLESMIKEKLVVVAKFYISWDSSLFPRNIARFYGQSLPSLRGKIKHVGIGEFCAYIVKDTNVVYQGRKTSSGEKIVNINVFDLKEKMREKTGGGHLIHATNDPVEYQHDLTVLLGLKYDQMIENYIKLFESDQSPICLNFNTYGLNGWPTMDCFIEYLNVTTNYVVLRNFDLNEPSVAHHDIDILTDSLDHFVNAASATKIGNKKYRAQYAVNISNRIQLIDVRSIHDNYYPRQFAVEILKSRVQNADKVWRPSEEIWFWSLLYHALVHKPFVSADYLKIFQERWPEVTSNKKLLNILKDYMACKEYKAYPPDDLSVDFYLEKTTFTRSLYKIYSEIKSLVKNIVYISASFIWNPIYKIISINEADYSDAHALFRSVGVSDFEVYRQDKWHLGFKYFSAVFNGRKCFCKYGPLALVENEVYLLNRIKKETRFNTPEVINFIRSESNGLVFLEFIEQAVSINESTAVTNDNINAIIDFAHWLNSQNIIHTDFRCENLLVAKKGDIYFIDFSMAMGPNLKNLPYFWCLNVVIKFFLGYGYKPKFYKWDNMHAAKKIVLRLRGGGWP